MDSIDYFHKYIKYKQKYIELKQKATKTNHTGYLVGGSTDSTAGADGAAGTSEVEQSSLSLTIDGVNNIAQLQQVTYLDNGNISIDKENNTITFPFPKNVGGNSGESQNSHTMNNFFYDTKTEQIYFDNGKSG